MRHYAAVLKQRSKAMEIFLHNISATIMSLLLDRPAVAPAGNVQLSTCLRVGLMICS